ncbi:6-phosphogluconolactonase [Nocardioides caeni]|uniref:6-phosphogluconolactonase n=1 Tax=Nocardioides caeni TaxID=574700 RepID=A0A4S8NAF9_9ACTN|nr:6-phosphogluconolactonase [Nocardioides caeni]THV13228.1 6-phosphogluconolactonase [Nocardioides caeni]
MTDVTDRPEALVEVHPDADSLATAVAGELLNRIADAQAAGSVPEIGLTGGSIAEAIHREVARLADDSGVDWGAVQFWFGDERFVPRSSPDRNAGQARAAFLDAVGAFRVQEVPAAAEVATAEEAAAAYAEQFTTQGTGGFDILMLGIGPDGHVASLFPGHPGLDVTGATTAAVHDSPKPPPDRVTFTFEALNRATTVWFVASGAGKADAVRRGLAESGSVAETPARGVRGERETTWFLDHDAAGEL